MFLFLYISANACFVLAKLSFRSLKNVWPSCLKISGSFRRSFRTIGKHVASAHAKLPRQSGFLQAPLSCRRFFSGGCCCSDMVTGLCKSFKARGCNTEVFENIYRMGQGQDLKSDWLGPTGARFDDMFWCSMSCEACALLSSKKL